MHLELDLQLKAGKIQSIKQLLIEEARAETPFSALVLPKVEGDELEQDAKQLEIVYQKYQAFYKEYKVKAQNLSDVFNPNQLTTRQKTYLNFRVEKSKDKEKALHDWNDKKDFIYKQIENSWDDSWQTLYKMRKDSNDQCVPKPFTLVIKKFFPNEKDTYILSYQLTCQFIWDSLGEMIIKEEETSIIDDFFTTHPNLFQVYAENQIQHDKNKVNMILKEQKQHSLARFCQLTQNYETFIRHTQIIEELAEEMERGSSKIIRKIVAKLLKHSHYTPSNQQEIEELKTKKDRNSTERQARLERIDKLLLIDKRISVKNNHHQPHLMGYEKPGHFSPHDKSNAIRNVNTAMQLFGTDQEVKNFQHAHTFPFPAMFNWKPKKIREYLEKNGVKIPDEFRPPLRHISLSFYKSAKNGMSQQELDFAFKEELKKIANEVNDRDKFMYCALDLLKQYHFKIFSETELTPDFINSELDQLSEWATTSDNYKKNIALSLRALIKRPQPISQKLVADSLKTFYGQSAITIQNSLNRWEEKNTVYNLVQRIGAIQIQQAQILNTFLVSSSETKGIPTQ